MPTNRPSTPDWLGIARVLGLVVLTCGCYWPSLGGGFLWDDTALISDDPLIQSFSGLRLIWFSTIPYDYFPLTYTSFWLEWPLWGADPLGYRVVNLGLHILSALLLWRLLERLRVPGAWLGALLFAVHPVNVASVAWIAERKNTLSMVFYLASVLCWVESEGERNRVRWYAAAVGFFMMAALSKSSVVMLPCILLLLVWWRRGKIGWVDLQRTVPFFVVSLVTGLLTVWFQFHRSMAATDLRRTAEPAWQRVLLAGRSMWFYLGKTVAPVRLSMIYPRWETIAWMPLVAVTVLLFAAWLGRTRWGRGPFTGLGYFALAVLPVSGLVPMTFAIYSFVSDHFVYVPMLGLLAGVAALLVVWSESGVVNRWAAYGTAALLVGWFVVLSFGRAEEFASSRRLWESTLVLNPRCAIAHNNLGLAIQDAGNLPDAEHHFRAALTIDPGLSAAATNLAGVLQREGRWRDSASAYESALDHTPDPKDFNNYGVVLLQLGDVEKAREQFLSAVRLEPSMLSPHFNLYRLALAQNHPAIADDELRACLHIDSAQTATRLQALQSRNLR